MNPIITGTVWKCGDHVTAYDVIGNNRWTLNGLDPQELGKWAFEGALKSVADVPFGFRNLGYDIVVAGHDFCGGGKSIEHPIVSMQGAGVRLILAESFSRYGFRNAINLALPAITCSGICDAFRTGDRMEANLLTGEIKNLSTGGSVHGAPLSDHVLNLIEAGGLLDYYRSIFSNAPLSQ